MFALLLNFIRDIHFAPVEWFIHCLCGCPSGLPALCMRHSKSWKQIQACEAGVDWMTAAFWSSCSAWGPYLTCSKMHNVEPEYSKKYWVCPSTRGPSPHAQYGALKTVLAKWANSVITRLHTAPQEAFFFPSAKSAICLCLITNGWNVLHFKIWSLPRSCLLNG